MRRAALIALALVTACSGSEPLPETADSPTAAAPTPATVPIEGPGPILVELFTSQGCSSCPPADRVLSQIGAGKFGDDVIALAYHVDYWDYIGWKDPFSKAEWTALQRRYGKTLAEGRVYTPMLVVNGRVHVVGSHRSRAESAIEDAREKGSTTRLELTLRPSKEGFASHLRWSGSSKAEVFVAIAESGLETDVRRGENAGEHLPNDHIVRRVIALGSGANGDLDADLPALAGWQRDRLEVVAFARDSATLAIVGATRGRLESAPTP